MKKNINIFLLVLISFFWTNVNASKTCEIGKTYYIAPETQLNQQV